MAVFPSGGVRWRWFLHCAAVCAVFTLSAGPVLMLNTAQFKSPFYTGYDFWVGFLSEHHLLFTLRYIPINAAALWREVTLGPLGFYAANIFGTGTSFVPAFIGLTCVGLFFIQIDRFVICASLAGLSSFAASLTYRFGTDRRFYLPLLILLVAIAMLPVSWAAKNTFVKARILPALAIFTLFGAACLGYPSRSGYNTREICRSQAWDALHFTNPPQQSTQFIAQRRLAKLLRRQPGIVLSDIDPVYLNALLPESFVAAPIDGNHHYRWSEISRYDQPQALALLRRGLEQSLPVYALFTSESEMPFDFLHPKTPIALIERVNALGRFLENVPLIGIRRFALYPCDQMSNASMVLQSQEAKDRAATLCNRARLGANKNLLFWYRELYRDMPLAKRLQIPECLKYVYRIADIVE